MDTRSIKEAVRRQPFRPFTLRMNDDREFYIPHPEYAAVSRRVVVVIDSITEAALELEPILIASMKPEGESTFPSAPPPGDNNGPIKG